MKTVAIDLPFSGNVRGKPLRRGVCDQVAAYLLHVIDKKVGLPRYSPGCIEDNEFYITPQYWVEINHFTVVIQCTDGKVLVDVPMKEYAYHDRVMPGDEAAVGHTKLWYWNGHKHHLIYFARSARDIQKLYRCKWSEAKEIAEIIKSCDDYEYQLDMTVDQFIDKMEG